MTEYEALQEAIAAMDQAIRARKAYTLYPSPEFKHYRVEAAQRARAVLVQMALERRPR